jgi:hypothetical protein
VGDGALGVGDGALGEGGGVRLVLAGAAELDWPVPADGLTARRSFTSRPITRIPMPMRATMATAAARPRRRGGCPGR